MRPSKAPQLVRGVDYYLDDGKFVFTSAYHRKRGHCCNSRCRHCPYGLAPSGAAAEPAGLAPAAPITFLGLPDGGRSKP